MTTTVTTASGRVYEIDLDEKRFRTAGEQEFALLNGFFSHNLIDDPHHAWTDFVSLDIVDEGLLVFVLTDGMYRKSTRVAVGLDDLVSALDGAA
jgi:hypothetical protein